ncbi:response regulator transcription factor [Rhodohalobacter sp. 614A]|uniref:response regulator transcription factor n=1 Tax=Rhodohalobacter sp. 614A TaxID=2908649 RepID=UPI001F1CC31B|nr:response regulator transcription factor [Rhodohalobacter sp. 614A]
MAENKKIYIVDDHPLMRKGLVMTIEKEIGFEVCGQAESAEEALTDIINMKPHVAVVDISLPGMNGIELIKNVLHQQPDLKILVVSRHDEELYAERALRAGAKGYLMKLEAAEVLISAIRQILKGGIYLSENIGTKLIMKMATGNASKSDNPLDLLSDRELEVFELTGKGLSTKEIGHKLHISVKTVESHRANIKDKLQVDTANELMRHAVKWVEESAR